MNLNNNWCFGSESNDKNSEFTYCGKGGYLSLHVNSNNFEVLGKRLHTNGYKYYEQFKNCQLILEINFFIKCNLYPTLLITCIWLSISKQPCSQNTAYQHLITFKNHIARTYYLTTKLNHTFDISYIFWYKLSDMNAGTMSTYYQKATISEKYLISYIFTMLHHSQNSSFNHNILLNDIENNLKPIFINNGQSL
jgi:hypothetical protein